jgi:hypothetical protein
MKSSKMVIGYKNSTGGITVTAFNGIGYTMPLLDTATVPNLVSLKGSAPSWATLSFSFEVPSSPTGPYIWASSVTAPTGILLLI